MGVRGRKRRSKTEQNSSKRRTGTRPEDQRGSAPSAHDGGRPPPSRLGKKYLQPRLPHGLGVSRSVYRRLHVRFSTQIEATSR